YGPFSPRSVVTQHNQYGLASSPSTFSLSLIHLTPFSTLERACIPAISLNASSFSTSIKTGATLYKLIDPILVSVCRSSGSFFIILNLNPLLSVLCVLLLY